MRPEASTFTVYNQDQIQATFMRTSRYLRPIHVSEFTALFLKVALMEEIGRVTVTQEDARDRFDRDTWAMLTVKLRELRGHLRDIEVGLQVLGPAPQEVLEEYAGNIHYEAASLPRSRTNRKQWDEHEKAERQKRREHVAKVREEVKAERAARKEGSRAPWVKPFVSPLI